MKDRASCCKHASSCKWECSDCSKAFLSEGQAKQHTTSPIHDAQVFHCPCCDEEFKILSALVQHVEHSRCAAEVKPGTPIAKMLHYLHMCVSKEDLLDILDADRGALT